MSYIFNTKPNSYFRGQDLRVEDTETHATITVNQKGDFWGLNVKAEYLMRQRDPAVQTAAANLTDGLLSGLEERAKEFFWREAEHLAVSHGFSGKLHQEGRSGGWLCLAETRDFESASPIEPTGEEKETIARWLNFCFEADELRETAEGYFDEAIQEANQSLQVELSMYADWVGAEIRTLAGDIIKVTKLDTTQGSAILRSGHSLFSFASEATLVRRLDGQVPSRLSADPIMEQVFQIIEARGDVTREQLNDWLDADDDHDPNELYVEHIAPAVNAIEDAIKADL